MSIDRLPEFDDHRILNFLQDSKTGLRAYVSIHRGGIKAPAFGATRYWHYRHEEDAIKDVLRLSETMSHKSAMAGLKYGGAKAVIMSNGVKDKKAVLRSYAEKLDYLHGHFVTGTDAGMTREDLLVMARVSDNFVGLKANPEKATVDGFFEALEVCMRTYFGDFNLSGRSFSVQGLGKTGLGIVERLYENGATIYASEVDKERIREVKRAFPKVNMVASDRIYDKEVDVFVPCALSHSINRNNIGKLKVKIIIGSANNQLEDDNMGEKLMRKGIIYAPDFVVNAGGLISVIDEYDPIRLGSIEEKIKNIGKNIKKIITASNKRKEPTNVVANCMARRIFDNFN